MFSGSRRISLLCFAPCFILNNVYLGFVRNDGAPQLAMAAMLTGSFSNIILDYVFIFPLGMGMFGAAIADTGLKIYFTAFLFAGFNIITAAYFSATESAGQAFTVSILRGCLFIISLVFLLSRFLGIFGVWSSYPLAEALAALAAFCLLKRKYHIFP